MPRNQIGLPVSFVALAALLAACGAPAAQSPTTAPAAATAAPVAATMLPAPVATAAPPKPTPEPRPVATPLPSAGDNDQAYLDDRSTAEALIDSFYNAINRREYGRAYGYWQAGATGLPPYDTFAQGYTTTSAVQVGYGSITGDSGAGQTRYSVPVRITAQTSGGAQYFVGCYILHLGTPAAQSRVPFQPLAIESAIVQQSAAPATAGALQQACRTQGSPVPPPAAEGAIDQSVYLDNQSDPVTVLRSFYNAINRHEYLRAYSYWQDQSQLPALPAFAQGYGTTQSVALETGMVQNDTGAGQRNYRVPVTIMSQLADGTTQTFAGCYSLHLAEPAIQGWPFKPLGITAANIQQVKDGTSATDPMHC